MIVSPSSVAVHLLSQLRDAKGGFKPELMSLVERERLAARGELIHRPGAYEGATIVAFCEC